MHLKSLGNQTLGFMRAHAENPPWLRAIRLLSQHLLERVADLDRWREVVAACSAVEKDRREPSAESLQMLDAWLEGIVFCAQPVRAFELLSADLLANNARLLRRLVRRLLHTGTIPDPVVQAQCRQVDEETAEAAATVYRLPIMSVWMPLLQFLLRHPEEITDGLPVELAEAGAMWARMEEYLDTPWKGFAELVLLNAEKELRREVAGEYHYERGPAHFAGRNAARVAIYAAGLETVTQQPDRAAKLLLKAAGRAPWEEVDLSEEADEKWRGEWEADWSSYSRGRWVQRPIALWPGGPTRRVSQDFFHAWFDSSAALSLYRQRPGAACEATLAFLLEWPKHEISRNDRYDLTRDRHGFTFEADQLYPPFYTKGPFLGFLRANWRPAVGLIVRLVNFATERVFDWLIEDPEGRFGLTLETPHGPVFWRGHAQAFCWSRSHQHTAQVITCALMALEKWLEEGLAAGESIAEPVEMLFKEGRSLAFAGVLTSIGKRHPALFLQELKPLLFVREFYLCDQQIVANEPGIPNGWLGDPDLLNQHRREWNAPPERRQWLLDLCRQWLLTRPEFEPVLAEVSATWRRQAEEMSAHPETRLTLLRWAHSLDRSAWKEVTLPDGRTGWQLESPDELRDRAGEEALARRQSLLMLPMQCRQLLEKHEPLEDVQAEAVWQQLQNWAPFEEHAESDTSEEDEFGSALLDHRHGRAGLLALLLCLGEGWLGQRPDRRAWVQSEVGKLLDDPPRVRAFVPEDAYDDGEGFLARCAVRCWAQSPGDPAWRTAVGRFVTAYRYRVVSSLFDEGFRVRVALGPAFRELEALAIFFAAARQRANRLSIREPNAEVMEQWRKEWLPAFALGHGPSWPEQWAEVEAVEPPESEPPWLRDRPRRQRRHRRSYGFDMGVLLAAFGRRLPLSEARDAAERQHWLEITHELLGAFLHTMPLEGNSENEEWGYDVWSPDDHVLDAIAARIFECGAEERARLWRPILDLPPAAHHHVTQFLSRVLLESMRTDPPRVADLLPIWREMAEHLLSSPRWTARQERGCRELWQHVFLYGTPFTCMGEECFAPLVEGLRDLFERHLKAMGRDAHDHAALAGFLVTKAGERLLVDAFTRSCTAKAPRRASAEH